MEFFLEGFANKLYIKAKALLYMFHCFYYENKTINLSKRQTVLTNDSLGGSCENNCWAKFKI